MLGHHARRAIPQAGGGAFSPLEVASLTNWLDMTDTSTLWRDTAKTRQPTDGEGVTTITDKKTGGDHTAAAQYYGGIYRASDTAGLPALDFPASHGNRIWGSRNVPFSMAVVFDADNTNNVGQTLMAGHTGGGGIVRQVNSCIGIFNGAGTYNYTPTFAMEPAFFVFNWTDTACVIYRNNVLLSTRQYLNKPITTLLWFGQAASSSNLQSTISEFMYFNANLTTEEMDSLWTGHIQPKYGFV